MASLAALERQIEKDKRELARYQQKLETTTAAAEAMRAVQDQLPKSVTPGARMAGALGTAGIAAALNGAFPLLDEYEAATPAVLTIGGVAAQMLVEDPELAEVGASLTEGAGSVFTYLAVKRIFKAGMDWFRGNSTPAPAPPKP